MGFGFLQGISVLMAFVFFVHASAALPREPDAVRAPKGKLVAWGTTLIPNVEPGTRFRAVASGPTQTAAVTTDGRVLMWGDGGNGTARYTDSVALALAVTNAMDVDVGDYFGAILRKDGTVTTWATRAIPGQTATVLVVPPDLTNAVAISCGNQHILALRADGTVTGWGNSADGRLPVPPGLPRVISIAAGGRHSIAVLEDGSIRGWGYNLSGQAGPSVYATNLLRIDAGFRHNVAVRNDSSATAWQSFGAGSWTNVVDVSAGEDVSFVLQSDGRVRVSLGNGIVSNLPPVVRLGQGTEPAYAIDGDGGLVRLEEALREGTREFDLAGRQVVAVSAGSSTDGNLAAQVLILEAGGTVQQWMTGNFPAIPGKVPAGLSNIVDIAAGRYFGMALREDGKVVTWSSVNDPPPPEGLANVVDLTAGDIERLALLKDGTVVALRDTLMPAGLRDVCALAAGSGHGLALKEDGTVVGWGSFGTPPAGLSNVVAIAAAGTHSLALLADGTVRGWGQSSQGALRIPPGLDHVVGISTTPSHSLALLDDGTVVRWDSRNSSFIPSYVRDIVAITASEIGDYGIRRTEAFRSIHLAPEPRLTFRTFRGRGYRLEHADVLPAASWTPTPGGMVEGNGRDVTVIDSTKPAGSARFYRLHEEPILPSAGR